MDRLSIFSKGVSGADVSLSETTLETVTSGLNGIKRELQLSRKGNEAFVWGQEVLDSDEIDLEDIEMEGD